MGGRTYKLEHHVQLLLPRRHILHHSLHVRRIRTLPHGHRIIPLQHLVHLPQKLRHPRPIAIFQPGELPLALGISNWRISHVPLTVHVNSINAEPVDAAIEPELHGGLVDGLACDGVLPVEIRLLGAEEVEVVFFRVLVPLPDGAAEVAEPIVRGVPLAVDVTSGPPDVPVALWGVFGGAGFLEPGVLCEFSIGIGKMNCKEESGGGCTWSDVWFTTKSRTIRMPRACVSAMSRSMSSFVPYGG